MWDFYCGWGTGYFYGGLLNVLMGIAFLVVIILVVFGVYYFSSRLVKTPIDSLKIRKYETPIGILKKRYASGEIDAEVFARLKKDLEEF
ncbi:MAG: SHOCT domain-containing protein [Clostridia bacterium]|nr:SHOCT domain-containing protein [Clostridia bacterium]